MPGMSNMQSVFIPLPTSYSQVIVGIVSLA
jgi:hypothetical protein